MDETTRGLAPLFDASGFCWGFCMVKLQSVGTNGGPEEAVPLVEILSFLPRQVTAEVNRVHRRVAAHASPFVPAMTPDFIQ
jgi:hypothetical protein